MSPTPDPFTPVELTWIEKRIEHWIRFGHDVSDISYDESTLLWTLATSHGAFEARAVILAAAGKAEKAE